VLGPSEGGLGGQDAPDGFPASGRNADLSGATAFFADGLLESSHLILALCQLFFVWCMFSLRALAVCSLDLCGSFLFFFICFWFGVAPFITIPVLVFHLKSHPLSLCGSF